MRRLGHPLLLLAVLSVVSATLRYHWNPSRVAPLFLVGTICYLATLERLIPYRTDWHPNARELRWYGVHFVLTMAGGALAQLLVTTLVGIVSPPHPAHRLHHSTEPAEAGHYGSDLSIWDRVFGSFTWHSGREPAAVGLSDPEAFPGTRAVLAGLPHPWRRAKAVEPSL